MKPRWNTRSRKCQLDNKKFTAYRMEQGIDGGIETARTHSKIPPIQNRSTNRTTSLFGRRPRSERNHRCGCPKRATCAPSQTRRLPFGDLHLQETPDNVHHLSNGTYSGLPVKFHIQKVTFWPHKKDDKRDSKVVFYKGFKAMFFVCLFFFSPIL